MEIERLLSEIIPPNDYVNRNGFDNTEILDSYSDEQRAIVEAALIEMLTQGKPDMLIIETLGYLKSQKSLPVLYSLLEEAEPAKRIIIAASIYDINKDNSLGKIIVSAFEKISENVYGAASMLHYLSKFNNNPDVRALLIKYTSHNKYLISYNARKALADMDKLN